MVASVMKLADLNKDGRLNYIEFVEMIMDAPTD